MAEKTANTMKAIQYDSYGGGAEALKHVDVPVPSPKKNEILLKLKAASLNPIDWKIQKGMLRPFMPPKFPFTPVADVCGEVVEAGSGVSSFKKGDEVVGMLHFPNGGGLAEYAASPVRFMVTKPPGLSPAEAAGLPTAAMTAVQALRATGTKFDTTNKPSNVLITAASGGVGHYAIQLAKHAGFHVTATCGARNIELMKSLGADEVLDYKTPEGATLRSPSGRKYDAVIHCTTNISWSTFEPNLSSNGKVIDITPTFKAMVTSVLKTMTLSKKKLVPLVLSPKIEDLKFLVDLAKEGKVKTVVDSIHPLSKAEEAWAKSMSGHATGKIIVEIHIWQGRHLSRRISWHQDVLLDTLLFPLMIMMMTECKRKKTFVLPTTPGPLIDFHGDHLPLHFFFFLWGCSSLFYHVSSLQAIWKVSDPKHMVS